MSARFSRAAMVTEIIMLAANNTTQHHISGIGKLLPNKVNIELSLDKATLTADAPKITPTNPNGTVLIRSFTNMSLNFDNTNPAHATVTAITVGKVASNIAY